MRRSCRYDPPHGTHVRHCQVNSSGWLTPVVFGIVSCGYRCDGLAQIEFMGEITSGRVIFGNDDAEPLLGVTALESVGILVDPANKTLKRLPVIPLK
jgi:hypothetical protein